MIKQRPIPLPSQNQSRASTSAKSSKAHPKPPAKPPAKASAKPKTTSPKPIPKKPVSAELVTVSDDEDDSDDVTASERNATISKDRDVNTRVTTPRAFAKPDRADVKDPIESSQAKHVEELLGDEDSSVEEDIAMGAEQESKVNKKPIADTAQSEESEDESEYDGDSSGKSSQDVARIMDDVAGNEIDSESEKEKDAATGPKEVTTTQKPAPPPVKVDYEPPEGFRLVPASKLVSHDMGILDPKRTKGKQIWHISAPANVPLSSIQQLSLEQCFKGDPILDVNGTRYAFMRHGKERTETMHVLVARTEGYRPIGHEVLQSLHLQQVMKLPNLSRKQADPANGSAAAASQYTPPVREPRAQPKGLRMRYRPFGFGSGDAGSLDSADDDDDEPAQVEQYRKPPELDSGAQAQKRKHELVDDAAADSQKLVKKPKKDKEKKKHREKPNSAPSESPVQGESSAKTSKLNVINSVHSVHDMNDVHKSQDDAAAITREKKRKKHKDKDGKEHKKKRRREEEASKVDPT